MFFKGANLQLASKSNGVKKKELAQAANFY